MTHSEPDAAAGLPAPAAGLMPHRRPVRLIETLLAADSRRGRAAVCIRGNPLFVTADGRLDATTHLELIAQTYATVKGWRERRQSVPPQTGYLVGAHDFVISGTAGIGDRLTITVQEDDTCGPFVSVLGQVHLLDQCLARGRVRLWLESPGRTLVIPLQSKAETQGTCSLPLDQAIGTAACRPLQWASESAVAQSFCFPTDFSAFQGHFPDNPVLPAFAQVRMVLGMLASAWENPVALERLEKAKFREPLRPGQTVQVHCRLAENPEVCRVAASLTTADRPLSSFQATVSKIRPLSK
jgi:3-hydroxyacyl-[acyl-carrier-protein] dehydratase